MEDNFYETSTERLIKQTSAQQIKAQQEKESFERERPLTTIVIAHLKEAIESREKVNSITETDDPEKFMRQVKVNQEVCSILKRDLNFLEGKAKMYDEKKLK